MTGDSENEIGSAGDSAIPPTDPRSGGANSFRPLRNWASAYGPEAPSLWSRMRARVSGMFGGKSPHESQDIEGVEGDVPAAAAADTGQRPEGDAADSAVVTPAGYSFPFARRDADPDVLQGQPAAPDMADFDDDAFDAAFDAERTETEATPPQPRPGFFSKVFQRKAGELREQPAVSPFYFPDDVPAPAHLEDERSPVVSAAETDARALDEALPADEALSEDGELLDDETPAQPKRGLFARLFGRKSRPVEPVDLEALEDAEDVTAQVEEAFASSEDAFAPPADSDGHRQPLEVNVFFSMDDALPNAEPAESPFARPPEPAPEPLPAMPPPVTPASLDLSSAPAMADSDMLFGDTIEPADIRPTLPRTSSSSAPRDTLEVEEVRSTVQVTPLDDESTDEFVQPVPPEVDAAAEAERPPFFVPKFRAFYNEIVLYKHQKSEFTAGFATAIVDYNADLTPDHAAQALTKRLQEILELQAAEAMWMGGEAAARYPDAQYAMAVLADELFTHMDWPGREAWPRYLLEQRMFKSVAGDLEFFRRVDKLLKNEANTPSRAARDLARLYLLVLASGFRGKYRVPNLARPLAEYRRRLYEFVYEGDPLLLYGPERRIFPQAFTRTLVGRAVSRFSVAQRWAAALILLIAGYTIVANVAWNRVSADLRDVTARVEAANATSTSDGAMEPR